MVNVVIEPESVSSTAPYAVTDPIQDNWGTEWGWSTTNLYRSALPFAFEQVIDYPRTETMPPLLTRLAEVLPRRMSKTYVAQLRERFPQLPATDDPATYEFETHQD